MIKLLFKGYSLGMINALIGTVFLTILHVFVFIINNGLQGYLQNWLYPRYIIGFGIIISLFPAGIAGSFLSFLLWRYKGEDQLTHKNVTLTSLIVGLCFAVLIFFIFLASPLGASFLRLDSLMQIIYFSVVVSFGGFIGLRTGSDISKIILAK